MNREIKFRAWLTDENKMVEVETIEWGVYQQISYEGCGTCVPMSKCKLLQYTGLTDKNGKEIYDGDVVQFDDGRVAEIGWHTWHPALTVYPNEQMGNQEDMRDAWEDEGNTERFEIIGNVMENPELLDNN